jgi:hypothetical protein
MRSVGGGPDSLNEVKFSVGRTDVSSCHLDDSVETRKLTEGELCVVREVDVERIPQREVDIVMETRVRSRVKLCQAG